MTDKKLTDQEIIKAFRECGQKMNTNYCDECPYNKGMCNDIQMATDILDLINHLQAEVEKQKKKVEARNKVLQGKIAENERLKDDNKFLQDNRWKELSFVKAEAYKEFAERLKEHKCSYDIPDYHSFDAVEIEVIDNTFNELLGEDNGQTTKL